VKEDAASVGVVSRCGKRPLSSLAPRRSADWPSCRGKRRRRRRRSYSPTPARCGYQSSRAASRSRSRNWAATSDASHPGLLRPAGKGRADARSAPDGLNRSRLRPRRGRGGWAPAVPPGGERV